MRVELLQLYHLPTLKVHLLDTLFGGKFAVTASFVCWANSQHTAALPEEEVSDVSAPRTTKRQ